MGQNKITVYSNGVTRVQKYVPIQGRTTIGISVRKACVADVLATLGVYGKVRVVEPPSYNNEATKNTLKINPASVSTDLATKLSGADVHITLYSGPSVTGKLVGIQPRENSTGGDKVIEHDLCVLTKTGVVTINAYKELEFTQPEVVRLIQNALSKNFENVRPDSVLVSLVVEPTSDVSEVLLDYAMPTAAWQSAYRLHVGEKATTLEYNAKVDNPTDEDWLNSKVSVVVGEPITCNSTLGEIRTPEREKLDLVSKRAVGPIRTQDVAQFKRFKRMEIQSLGGSGPTGAAGAAGTMGFAAAAPAQYSGELDGEVGYLNCAIGAQGAEVSGASSEEVGDFAVFVSNDVIDIRNNNSGMVRLFTETVDAKELLFFNYTQDQTRAYRGVRLTNTTKNTLGQGICTVYLGETLAGQAEFKTCKPGKSQTVVFSRENGVDVHCVPATGRSTRTAIGMSSGELWWQDRFINETSYKFANLHKDASFEVEVDHTFTQQNPEYEVVGVVKAEKTKTGLKITFDIEADGTADFTVVETKVTKNGWKLEGVVGTNRFANFFSSDDAVAVKVKVAPGYKLIETLSAEYGDITANVNTLTEEAEQLKKEQDRLLALVKTGSAAVQLGKWQDRLDKTEDRITTIEKTEIPQARKDATAKDKALTEALKAFAFDWAVGNEKAEKKSKK